MNTLTQLNNQLKLPRHIEGLKRKINELPLRIGLIILENRGKFVDQKTIDSFYLINPFLEQLKDSAQNANELEAAIKEKLSAFVNEKIPVDFPTNFGIHCKTNIQFYKDRFDKKIDDYLDERYREKELDIDKKQLADELSIQLSRILEPELKTYLTGILLAYCGETIVPRLDELDLRLRIIDEEQKHEFIKIFNKEIDRLIIPATLKLIDSQRIIREIIEEDTGNIDNAVKSLRLAEKAGTYVEITRTHIEERTSRIEERTKIIESKTQELENECNEVKLKIAGIGELQARTKDRFAFWVVLLFAMLMLLINLVFILKPNRPTSSSTPAGVNCDDFIKRLDEIEQKFNEITESQKKIKILGNFEWDSFKGVQKAPDGNVLVALDIDVLSEKYRWKCGSSDTFASRDREYDPEIVIESYADSENLEDAKGIICVGMASAEGQRGLEEERSENRMETLRDIAMRKLGHICDCPIYGLNLGQYKEKKGTGDCTNETLWQRRILLLKITQQKPDISDKELKEGVVVILEKKSANRYVSFPIDVRRYSKYKDNIEFRGESISDR